MPTLNKISAAGQNLNALEAYAQRPGFLQRTPAVYKVVFTLCFIMTVVSVSKYNWPGLTPFAAYPVIAVNVIGLPWRLFLKRLLTVLPFVAVLGGANIFLDAAPVWYAAGFSLSGGAASFITLMLKALLTVGAVQLLAASTPLNAVAGALTHLRVPCLFVMQLLLTWRYAGLLAHEAARMCAAYQLRGGTAKGVQIKHWPQFIGMFLLRAISRAQTVARAMNCRLFDVRQIQYAKPPFKISRFMFWLIACCLCFVLRIWF